MLISYKFTAELHATNVCFFPFKPALADSSLSAIELFLLGNMYLDMIFMQHANREYHLLVNNTQKYLWLDFYHIDSSLFHA